MASRKQIIFLLILAYCYTILLYWLSRPDAHSQVAGATATVDVTVTLSHCQNGLIEDGEDCEPSVAITKSCQDFDPHKSGQIKCRDNCLYDFSGCLPQGSIKTNSDSSKAVVSQTASRQNIPILFPVILSIVLVLIFLKLFFSWSR